MRAHVSGNDVHFTNSKEESTFNSFSKFYCKFTCSKSHRYILLFYSICRRYLSLIMLQLFMIHWHELSFFTLLSSLFNNFPISFFSVNCRLITSETMDICHNAHHQIQDMVMSWCMKMLLPMHSKHYRWVKDGLYKIIIWVWLTHVSRHDNGIFTYLILLQRIASIEETGLLDDATLKLLRQPRCGNPDYEIVSSGARRHRRYALGPSKWQKLHLTWK